MANAPVYHAGECFHLFSFEKFSSKYFIYMRSFFFCPKVNADSVSTNNMEFTIMEKLSHSFIGKECLTCITKGFPRDKLHGICELVLAM